MISMSWESRSEPGLNRLNGMTEGFEHCSSDLDTSSQNGPLVDALSYSWGNPERPRRSGACSLEKAFEAWTGNFPGIAWKMRWRKLLPTEKYDGRMIPQVCGQVTWLSHCLGSDGRCSTAPPEPIPFVFTQVWVVLSQLPGAQILWNVSALMFPFLCATCIILSA